MMKIRKWLVTLENKILLSIMNKLFLRYKRKSTELNKYTNIKNVWYGTNEVEEKTLNQCQQVLQRRLQLLKPNDH